MRRPIVWLCLVFGPISSAALPSALGEAPDYARDVAPILAKYCLGCHGADEPESGLSLHTFAALQQGGANGAALAPGQAENSLLFRVLTGNSDITMPPEESEQPTAAEIELLRAWIDSGAAGPSGADEAARQVDVPRIEVAAGVRPYVTSLAVSPDGARVALGGFRSVQIFDAANRKLLATSAELPGKVNAASYSPDGTLIVAASGQAGVHGAATILSADDGRVVKQITGHRDTLYDAQLSPDGRVLATCSYDRDVNLWDMETGKLQRALTGHTGAVFEIVFSPDGANLASASADATIKIWDAANGARLDTLGQAEREQYCVAVSPDGKQLAGGGADRKIRIWRMQADEQRKVRPLVAWRAAHKSPVVEIAYSPDGSQLATASDGGELTVWDVESLTPLEQYPQQGDVVTGLEFSPAGDHFFVARLNGSWERYASPRATDRSAAAEPLAAAVDAPTPTTDDKAPAEALSEHEPNDSPDTANAIASAAIVSGTIAQGADGKADVDVYRFTAAKRQRFVLEINAARQKSPLDSRLEALDATGRPIPRVLMRAVRETYLTFRGTNSDALTDFRLHGWEDMELNEYLYANGEVIKLWLYPRGPDSGFLVYPGTGDKRYSYFGTTPITHALNEPCYIVEAHPPHAKLLENGLPQFLLYYENDDDGMRRLGADSRLTFTAPAAGDYLVRVSDTRGQGGDAYRYKLHVRPPRADFAVRLDNKDKSLEVSPGNGKEVAVAVRRIDDFDGEVQLEVTGLPPGFHVAAPWSIEAGQNTAYATLTADADAPAPTAENCNTGRIIASAMINGERVVKDSLKLGTIKLADAPKVLVRVRPTNDVGPATFSEATPVELEISPGETISARVVVERHGFDGEVGFGKEHAGRNLPHGVFVDNIGLNGVVVMPGATERQFFITAAKWVSEGTRLFHLRVESEPRHTSQPVVLHVRKGSRRAENTQASSASR